MRKRQREKTFDPSASLTGMLLVVLLVYSFLVFLGIVIVATRALLG